MIIFYKIEENILNDWFLLAFNACMRTMIADMNGARELVQLTLAENICPGVLLVGNQNPFFDSFLLILSTICSTGHVVEYRNERTKSK